MKKILSLCLSFLIATVLNAQISLGGGNVQGGYVPIDVNYGYNYSQQIFAKNDINATSAGSISGLKFYLPSNADISSSVNWVVYIGSTTKTSFSSTTDWIPVSGLSQVFSGSVVSSNGEVTVNFSTPFAYNNTDNLVIAVYENTPSYTASSNKFFTYTGISNSTLAYRSDSTDPSPTAPPTGVRTDVKSNITFMGLTPATVPNCPSLIAPAATATAVSVFPTFTWSPSSNAASYVMKIGTTSGGSDVFNQNVGNVGSYTLTSPLNVNTQYFYSITAVTSQNVSSPSCAERSFTTVTSLACPTVSSPAAAATGTSIKPTFVWSAASGAAGYRLSIGTSAGANNILNNFDLGNVLTYSLTAAQQLNPSTQYYYTISSYNGSATPATACSERSFTTGAALPPANDDCSGAIQLTVNSNMTCTTSTPGNTLGSTQSMAATPCSGTPNDDVWFSFVATASSHIISLTNIVSTGTSSTTDMYFQVLSGSCGNMSSLVCSDPDSNIITGLAIGQTYYVRVYTYSSNANAFASFNVCVLTPPAPPANDDCVNAVTVTVNTDLNCGGVTSGTTAGGTGSGVSVGACTGTPDDDVWYKFVASSTSHTFQLKNVVSVGTSSSTSLYAQIFSGACGTLTSTTCITSNSNYSLLSGLVIGQTYYVRVYNSETNSGASLYANTFDVCIGTLPAAPLNDNCSGAVNLTVGADLNCTTPVAGTTLAATNSGVAVGTCTGTPDDDVWYSFTATGAIHNVLLSNVVASGTSTSTSLYTQVFTGACGTLTSFKCGTTTNTQLTGLTPGQVYYVRVYNSNANTTTLYANNFNICIGTPPPPPANDNCTGAISLIVSATSLNVNAVNGTTVSATQSTGTAPTCTATGINDDVWYSFSATSTTHLVNVLYSDNATTTQIYSGACGSLTAISCFEGAYGNSNVILNNLVVGNTYYIRVFSKDSSATVTSNFQIGITTPATPVNDTCATAIAISCNGTVQGNNALAQDEVLPSSTCGSTGTTASYKGVWYTITATQNGPITVDACGSKFDTYLRVYTGTCSSLTCFANTSGQGFADAGCTSNVYNASTLTFTGVAGTTYYVLLSSYSAGQMGDFSISVNQSCGSLSTLESGKKDKISLYPNPFSNVLNISDIKNVKSVSIVDVAGRTVKTFDKPSASLQLSELNSGMYIVVMNMNDGSKQSVKVIKK